MKVFITGVSRGLGAVLACRMAASNHMVFGMSRSGAMPSTWHPDFKGRFWKGDAYSRETVSRIVSELRSAGNIPDMIIFNAASMEEDMAGNRFDAKIAEKVLMANCLGPFLWIEEFLPDFLTRKTGSFAAISSLVAYRPLSKGLHNAGYVASKAGLSSSFDFFRLYYAGTGVKFFTFHMGRMGISVKGVPCVTYEKAADFIYGKLHSSKNRLVFDYPLTSAFVYRFSRLIPDRLWSGFIKKG